MIRRTMDATLFNEVANDPHVRPFIGGGDAPLDMTGPVANPDNYALEAKGGGFWLHPLLPGLYELHTLFLPRYRGKAMFAAAVEMFRFMFTQTPCLEIVTKCPDDNGGARWAAGKVGFRERFRRDDAWVPGVGVSYRVFSADDWFIRDPECLAAGRAFHEVLEAAKLEKHGEGYAHHAEDPTHDRAVGAACLMAQAGNPEKGAAFLNRWSVFAGYATIASLGGGVFDIGDAIVRVQGGQTEVLFCR